MNGSHTWRACTACAGKRQRHAAADPHLGTGMSGHLRRSKQYRLELSPSGHISFTRTGFSNGCSKRSLQISSPTLIVCNQRRAHQYPLGSRTRQAGPANSGYQAHSQTGRHWPRFSTNDKTATSATFTVTSLLFYKNALAIDKLLMPQDNVSACLNSHLRTASLSSSPPGSLWPLNTCAKPN